MTLNCKICGKSFDVYPSLVSRRKHCSRPCQDKAAAIRHQGRQVADNNGANTAPPVKSPMWRYCQGCKGLFKRNWSKHDQRFCSISCAAKNRFRKKRGNGEGSITRICAQCKRTFTTCPSRNLKFCSRQCQNLSRRRRVTMICELCGDSYIVRLSRALKTHYCSRHCAVKALTICEVPNKGERKLEKLLDELFPQDWKFVGDGAVKFGRKSPDFMEVNGQKKLIEFFGHYWHQDPKYWHRTEEGTVSYYRDFGFETLVVWDFEFNDLTKLSKKIKEFHYA